MDTILIEPKNKKELVLVTEIMNRMNISCSIQKKVINKKLKTKQAFLNSLPERLNEVKRHMEGKIKLKSWDEIYIVP